MNQIMICPTKTNEPKAITPTRSLFTCEQVAEDDPERNNVLWLRGVSWFPSPAASYDVVQVKSTGGMFKFSHRTGSVRHAFLLRRFNKQNIFGFLTNKIYNFDNMLYKF